MCRVCVCVHAVLCPSVRGRLWQCEAVWLTWMGVWAPDDWLGADGAAALAGPLGKLVHLTSLNLSCMWHGGVVCVLRVCMHAVLCPSVRGSM